MRPPRLGQACGHLVEQQQLGRGQRHADLQQALLRRVIAAGGNAASAARPSDPGFQDAGRSPSAAGHCVAAGELHAKALFAATVQLGEYARRLEGACDAPLPAWCGAACAGQVEPPAKRRRPMSAPITPDMRVEEGGLARAVGGR